MQLFRVTCFIAGKYNTRYYGTFTDDILFATFLLALLAGGSANVKTRHRKVQVSYFSSIREYWNLDPHCIF